jgi:subtilisin family serine protease
MYTYQLGGKDSPEIELTEAPDLVVVRTEGKQNLQELNLPESTMQAVGNTVAVAAFPEANVTVYRCVNKKKGSAIAQRNTVRSSLNGSPGIRFAGRALTDRRTGEPVVYTENLFVKFSDDVAVTRCSELLAEYGLKIKDILPFAQNAYFVEAEDGTGLKVFEIAQKLLERPEVELCHPELIRQKKERSIYPRQWHLQKATFNNREINQHVNVEDAWTITKGEGIIIAVIDDGIDVMQEEFNLPGKIVAPRDTLLDSDDGTPKDWGDNHGTCCAGVACASGRFKASGVAPDARLMPIRTGSIGSMSEAKAFAWAADHGAHIISCSWGPNDGNYRNTADPLHSIASPLPDHTRLAIDYAATNGRNGKGCIITFAAGNGNESVDLDGYASYSNVFAIAACNDQGQRSYYSDYGNAVICSFPSNDVSDIPGRARPLTPGIWTTDRVGIKGRNPGGVEAETLIGDLKGNYTATFGGTSSACPGAAGVLALVLAANPNLGLLEIREIIKNSSDKIDKAGGTYDDTGHSIFFGYGRLNAGLAVQHAIAARQTALPSFKVGGDIYLNSNQNLPIEDGEIKGSLPVKTQILGFQLNLMPLMADLSLRYQAFTSAPGSSTINSGGEFAGTRDRRRKLTGFSISLSGTLADKYDIIYQAGFGGNKLSPEMKNGTLCGIDKPSGKSITRLRVQVVQKS